MRALNLIIILFLFCGCIKQIKLNYRTPPNTLVVEGLLLTDSTPCKVSLSYSGLFNEKGGQLKNYITDAIVFVYDDMNDSLKLTGDGAGNYTDVHNEFYAKPEHSYYIKIFLSNGETYASVPENIPKVVNNFELDTIGVSPTPALPDLFGADIKINIQDPPDETNYYRWITRDYVPRKATGVPCSFGNPPAFCNQYCYQVFTDSVIRILSDKNINGNLIRDESVLISPYYYYGNHFVEIKQLSLTREAYQFWQLYQQQTTRTGTIEDPLPSALNGNVYNIQDSTQLALGYFEASDAVSKKYILAPQFINSYFTLANITRYIYPEQGNCWDVYPNAFQYGPDEWNNLTPLIYNVY